MAERANRVNVTHSGSDDATRRARRPAGRHVSADNDADPKAIAVRIERTRSEITKTIAAIAERLSPERLADEAIGAATKMAEQAEAAATKMTAQAEKAADDMAREALDEAKAAVRELTD